MRSLAVWLALSALAASPRALAAPSGLPIYIRTQLDDDASPPPAAQPPREPRRIRITLDDASHASFPLDPEGRLIRVSLEDGDLRYGHLAPSPSRTRRVRTELD
ncbi:MAG TPA: hypothetical protein VHP33_34290 [Polyangiaceae bacterium]|nr:hypothetical protein [Polyangiaceae bacterium]